MGVFTPQEFNNFWDSMQSLNTKFTFYKGKSAQLLGRHVTTSDIPSPSLINSFYERNLDKLAALTSPLITLDTRTWEAREVYTRADFNRMITQLGLIEDNLEAEVSSTLYCGTFKAGSDRTVQLLGRGN